MTYTLDIELNDPLEAAIDDVIGEVEEAIGNIRKYRPERIMHQEEVDVHDLLAQHHAVALVFSISDVKKLRPDLPDEQAWEVLRLFGAAADDCPDPMHETIIQLADMHFPRKRPRRMDAIAKIIADYDPNGDERENLVDLLTDAMHWCDGFGEPFDEFYSTARIHFDVETKGA